MGLAYARRPGRPAAGAAVLAAACLAGAPASPPVALNPLRRYTDWAGTGDLFQLSGLRPQPELRDLAERFGVLPSRAPLE